MNLTDQERQALLQIFDIALKSDGLRILDNIVYFMQKLQESAAKSNQDGEQ